jgi:proteasome regulatory subunit
MALTPDAENLQWALNRRLEDVFSKLGEKYGDLTGRVETTIRPGVAFDDVGGLQQAKEALRGFAYALTEPERYRQWGIHPPRGALLYGPPGTGKTMLARALATAADAVFFHLKLFNLTSKFGPNTGELLQEIMRIAIGEGRVVMLMDELEALSLEHLLPPPQAREASARLVAALCEKFDALDPALVTPGRLDHLIEIPLPDTAAQQEILDLVVQRTQKNAGRPLFEPIDPATLLPLMGGMSGADISVIVRRALEAKVYRAGSSDAARVTTGDLLEAVDAYKRVRGVVEKIRYGQYL